MMELDFDAIRKAASHERGRRAFEGEKVPFVAEVAFRKAASADLQLLSIAAKLGGDLFETYEALGGRYKTSR
jgi:hypothetical protein